MMTTDLKCSGFRGMDTTITVYVGADDDEAVFQEAHSAVIHLESLLSRYQDNSEICQINRSAGKGFVKVSEPTMAVLKESLEFSRASHGSFDITIGPLIDLWRSSKVTNLQPDEAELLKALSLVNYTGLLIDEKSESAALKSKGQSIDLGGIGKGYAADQIIALLKQKGLKSGAVNFGGNVATLGSKPGGEPWHVGIRHPRLSDNIVGTLKITGKSVVTSGDYERFYMDASGERQHHLLSPLSGRAVQTGLLSTTIISDSSTDADALSSILFLSGIGKGLPIISQYKAEAILIDKDMRVIITPGLKEIFIPMQGIEVYSLN